MNCYKDFVVGLYFSKFIYLESMFFIFYLENSVNCKIFIKFYYKFDIFIRILYRFFFIRGKELIIKR